ncbi:MAG: acyl-CoA dehydrogenase family protein [Gammaproteobacteria bacterium]|nr:acyl-CoA dehydrogenase family protein [Gammaproteobacteria bacterium]
MQSIYMTEELELIRAQIRRFVEEEVQPHGEVWEESGEIPRAMFTRMGELGFLGMCYPAEYGGGGCDTMVSAILAEELGRSTFGGFSAAVLVHTDMASPHLANFGSEEQKRRYLPGICDGSLVTAIGVTEPDAGSDVAGLRTRAVREGDEWVLNGSKMFITNGAYANVYFIAARTDPEAKGSQGISMFIVDKGTPGFSVSRKLDKMGWRCSDTAELVFEDCRLPLGNLLGELNKGFYSVMKNFQNERIVIGGMAVGESEKALELTLDYVRNRKAFGGALIDKQAIRQRLAMLWSKLEAARQLLYHTTWLDTSGADCVKEVSMLKAMSAELVNEVMYDCLQFHGGFGYIKECAIERMARDARILPIGGGATEVMLEEVAKRFDL